MDTRSIEREVPTLQTTEPASIPIRRFDPRRIYTALAFVPLFYGLVLYLPPIAFTALVLVAASLALLEFYRLSLAQDGHHRIIVGLGLSSTLLLLASYHAAPWNTLHVLEGTLGISLLYSIFSPREMRGRLTDSAILIFGVVYVGWTLGYLILIRQPRVQPPNPHAPYLIFFLVITTWAADAGGYYVGTTFGRHALAPTVSPKKTIEGLFGGLGVAIVVACMAKVWFVQWFTWFDCIGLGILLTVAGAIGDLAESVMKRSAGVKDSGGLLPGHGGVLDRLDSLMLTSPTFFYYALYAGLLYPEG